MGKIRINNMKVFTFNGVLPEEKVLGQPLEIDIELSLPLEKAGETDDVYQTVSYADVYQTVYDLVTTNSYDLIETVVYQIIQAIENQYGEKLTNIKVRVRKYSVPINGIFDNVEIEMEKELN